MPLLVDGDNLLGTSGRARTDAERRRLALQLDRSARHEGKRVVTVFDGPAPGVVRFGAEVRFAGSGRSADDLILEILRGETDRRGWTVVTSDRSLGDRCRWLGARVLRCHEFRSRLVAAGAAEKPERETEIDYWLERFGTEDPEDGPDRTA